MHHLHFLLLSTFGHYITSHTGSPPPLELQEEDAEGKLGIKIMPIRFVWWSNGFCCAYGYSFLLQFFLLFFLFFLQALGMQCNIFLACVFFFQNTRKKSVILNGLCVYVAKRSYCCWGRWSWYRHGTRPDILCIFSRTPNSKCNFSGWTIVAAVAGRQQLAASTFISSCI